MAIKIYQKRGNLNYKERRMIAEIEEAITKKFGNDPSIEERFSPATNFEQLKELHTRYCVEDVEFQDVKTDNSEEEIKMDSVMNDDTDLLDEDDNSFIDPMNREEPIVRDYVMDEDISNANPSDKTEGPIKTSFDEPASFEDAFNIPGQNIGQTDKSDSKKENQTLGGNNNQQKRPQSTGGMKPQQPFNPDFDDMSNKKKKKSTQRFAKYIVETVCLLAEKGFVWYANKDINEAKLAEYEVSGEIDLSLIVTLEDGQEATIKQFFSIQCIKAEQLAVISKEEKDDLIDALAEVLMEKGVAPTPTQELMMISLKILGGQAVKLIALKSQTNDLLAQLRAMKKGDNDSGEYIENNRQTYQEPVRQEAPRQEVVEKPIPQTESVQAYSTEEEDVQFLLGDSKETIE